MATLEVVETFPLRKAKDRLSALVDRVQRTHERVTITRNGQDAAVLISPDDLESLEETLDILSSPETMRRIREGVAAVAAGDVVDEAGLRALLAEHGR